MHDQREHFVDATAHTPAALSASFDEPNLLVLAGLVPALRRAGEAKMFTGVRAPSTLGTFLRGFRFGHVRQLDAVATRTLTGLAQVAPLLPGIAGMCLIDIDDTVKGVYGPGKQGAQFGYTKVRGLNAQLATISTTDAAPVIAAPSSHGAIRMLRDVIATARHCGYACSGTGPGNPTGNGSGARS